MVIGKKDTGRGVLPAFMYACATTVALCSTLLLPSVAALISFKIFTSVWERFKRKFNVKSTSKPKKKKRRKRKKERKEKQRKERQKKIKRKLKKGEKGVYLG